MIPLEITHDDLTFSQESQEDGRRVVRQRSITSSFSYRRVNRASSGGWG